MTGNPAATRQIPSRRQVLRLAAAVPFALSTSSARALDERIWHDPYTGIAIGGYDPVAYFIDGEPRRGDPENEVAWNDAFWRFVNKGNAAAFTDAPAVYMPAYGGFGTLGVAGGVPQPSDPRVFAVHRQRLFLFRTPADRVVFLSDPQGIVALADAKWPAVRAMLAR